MYAVCRGSRAGSGRCRSDPGRAAGPQGTASSPVSRVCGRASATGGPAARAGVRGPGGAGWRALRTARSAVIRSEVRGSRTATTSSGPAPRAMRWWAEAGWRAGSARRSPGVVSRATRAVWCGVRGGLGPRTGREGGIRSGSRAPLRPYRRDLPALGAGHQRAAGPRAARGPRRLSLQRDAQPGGQAFGGVGVEQPGVVLQVAGEPAVGLHEVEGQVVPGGADRRGRRLHRPGRAAGAVRRRGCAGRP